MAACAISTTAHVSSSKKINLWNAFTLFNTHLKWWLIILSNAPAKHSNFSFCWLQLLKVKDLLLFSIFYDNKLNIFWSICQIQLEAHPLTVMGKCHYFMSLFYNHWSIPDNKKQIQHIDLSGKSHIVSLQGTSSGRIVPALFMSWCGFSLF